MRKLAILLVQLTFTASAFAISPAPGTPPPPRPAVHGSVADPTGAIVPGAEVDLVDPSGAVAGKNQSDGEGNFTIVVPRAGAYTLIISEPGFDTVRRPVQVISPGNFPPAVPMRIVLPIAALATTVRVNGDNDQDLTAPENNHDSSVLSANDLKSLPVFDNDYASAMSAFMDSSAMGTGGSGLLVDGIEANRATVSASAVQEVRINQDPYSAQYYWPGRGQMEIITKSAADHYHGQFNFMFRDSAMNAQNALAPSKPFEQRRVYEGHTTGPIPHAKKSSFLFSINRAEEDLDSIVKATVAANGVPAGVAFNANVPAPTRDTEFSMRAAHQFGEKHSAYIQYSYQDWHGANQGVGGQTLAEAAFNNHYHEDDAVAHVDSTLSATVYNQASVVVEADTNRHTNMNEQPRVSVQGYFSGGSAQNDSLGSEYNVRLSDMVTWTRGRHMVKMGASTPHIDRRAFDDNTNALGSYTFGPTLDANGNTVQTAIQNYTNHLPSGFSQNTGDVHFVYHQQEAGAFVQDQIKLNDQLSVTPGLRYDWQNFLANKRLGFSPRVSFAWMLNKESKTVLRGGGGIYYDRFGSGPLLDLARYSSARRRSVVLSLDPGQYQNVAGGCVPISNCVALTAQPPSLAVLDPNAKIPYQIQYGLSIERQLGEKATGIISGYSARGVGAFRSVDINAPTPESGYSERPDSDFGRIRDMQSEGFWEGCGMDVSYRGRLNKYFTGFGRYTWSHYESNTGGIGWFPQNQYDPSDEWANSNWDSRQRLGMYAMFQPESVFNLAAGIWANAGSPWTELTGTDPYGDDLFNARPDGVARNSETNPSYVDLDLRWGHDFAITANHDEDAPRVGFSAGAFNVLNRVNGGGIDPVVSSSSFGEVTSAAAPRRIQLGMRVEF